MDKNRWFIFAGLCIAVVAGLVFLSNSDKVSVDNVDAFTIQKTEAINDQVYGNKNAKVVVYEYGDFQCPGCAGAFPNLKTIKETYKGSIAFVYRHFPLTTAHPHAFAAAAAAESAGLQGKFWEMHDLIFQSQDSWKNLKAEERQKIFEDYARQLKLNIDQYNSDLTSKKVTDKVNFDRSLGLKIGVDSTPTLYINNKIVNDDVTSDLIQQQGTKFTEELNKAITAAGGTVPKSTTTEQ